jgi:hypothetical protein
MVFLAAACFFGFSAALANPCPEGAIEGKGIGGTADKAIEDANLRIARDIFSKAHSISIDSLIKKETDDSFEEKSTRRRVAKVETFMPNVHAIKNKDGKPPRKEEGNFISERYICNSDAAKPYLDSLDIFLRNKLKVFMLQGVDEENCENAREIYAKTLGWQRIVENLRQTNKNLQKEYEHFNAKIESDCARRGVYLEVKGARAEIIKDKLNELLSLSNCHIEQKPKSGTFSIKIDAKDCNIRNDGTFDYCSACANVEIMSGRNKIPLGSITAKAGWNGKSMACEKAAEEAAPEIWGKVKDRIKEVCQ